MKLSVCWKRSLGHLLWALSVSAILAACGGGDSPPPATVKVFSDGPLEPALRKVAVSFTQQTGYPVEYVFANSPVIQQRVAAGEVGDVLIVQPDIVDQLTRSGRVQ